MFQDIAPHVFNNEYDRRRPAPSDYLVLLDGRKILLSGDKKLPTAADFEKFCPQAVSEAFYLFSIDETGFFFTHTPFEEREEIPFRYQNIMVLRDMESDCLAFGAAVAAQLGEWYSLHRFCGCCAVPTVHSDEERAIRCPSCGHLYYPRISPVVIIAIVDGDKLLLTRYNRSGYRRHALVAGFVEVGETLEDAVRRETMEEVGLKVKNIRYCESQPWPFSSSLIAGFFADVDGDPSVHLNTDGKEELSEGIWVNREDLVIEDNSVSLTWDMIRKFRDGLVP
jgi:NAD+ diphosphatase